MTPISIIVPIYNMEKLMRKCLDSILVQTFKDYECLLIDDGSTDGSPAICDEYAAKDNRFKAYHKPNGGLSDARNYGLERAQGKYTIFFDPDDWVDEDCLKEMYGKAQETDADMVICDYYYEDLYRSQCIKQSPSSLNHYEVLKDMIIGELYGYTWNKLLSRCLYDQYDLQYPVGIYGCEDQYTMCALLKNDIRIAYLPQAYYHYMHYSNETQSRRYDKKTLTQDVQVRDMFVQLLADTPFAELAFYHKTHYMFGRAFMLGYQQFTSKSFVDTFRQYEELILSAPLKRIYYFCYWLSFRGYYRFSRRIFGGLFSLKQYYNRIISFIR